MCKVSDQLRVFALTVIMGGIFVRVALMIVRTVIVMTVVMLLHRVSIRMMGDRLACLCEIHAAAQSRH